MRGQYGVWECLVCCTISYNTPPPPTRCIPAFIYWRSKQIFQAQVMNLTIVHQLGKRTVLFPVELNGPKIAALSKFSAWNEFKLWKTSFWTLVFGFSHGLLFWTPRLLDGFRTAYANCGITAVVRFNDATKYLEKGCWVQWGSKGNWILWFQCSWNSWWNSHKRL